MRQWIQALVICVAVVAVPIATWAQAPEEKPDPAAKADADQPDEGEAKKKKKPESKIKPYDEVITDKVKSDPGLFLVHRENDDVYFEIPVSELGAEMVWVTQLAETQAGYSWAGMPVGDRVVRWEQRGDRILLRDVRYDIRADVDDPIRLAVAATSLAPIIQIFDVVAYGKDKAPVIQVDKFLTSDPPEFSAKEAIKAKGIDGKRSFVDQVKSFPTNIETRVMATYKLDKKRDGADGGPGFPSAIRRDPTQSGVTVMLHHSMIKLPEEPMRPRRFDDRVGFFNLKFADYGDDSDHAVEQVRYIKRWRLEKKKPKSKLSEPVEPIVWYVSREVPAKWQPYVIEGINAWQPAFESAGFKNAIVGKLAPTPQEDPDWDPEDARYTTIRWLPSAVPNAFGPHVADPRTGEILEADVRMFHNVIKLVRDWYFVQASPSDPRAQKLPMPDELMGELIAFVVAHEVGHSLGFPHNMKASSAYTVEQLRDSEFTRANGTAPSIMDYARFNYVAQPGDGASLLPAIGRYDHFAVEWGYRQYADDEAEKAGLAEIVARQVGDPWLRFGDPNPRVDPTQQTEDLGADAVAATRLGLQNLERVAGFLVEASSDAGEDYGLLENMHNALLGQWRREMVHVANVVGGVELINLRFGDSERRYHPVDPQRQREAVAFLNEKAFRTPTMFLDPDVVGRLEASGVAGRVLSAQQSVLRALVRESRVKRMAEVVEAGGEGSYAPVEMLADLTAGIFAELQGTARGIDLYRRNLQRSYVGLLADGVDSSDSASDVAALARGELIDLRERIRGVAGDGVDATTRRHLDDVVARIELVLEKVRVQPKTTTGARPTGRGLD